MAGSGQEQDVDIFLFISEIISSENTLEDGICLHLEHSSTCGAGPGVDDVCSLSTGKAFWSGTGGVESIVEDLSLCTVDDVERNLKPSGFTVKSNF
jgi:hypothetical protein